MCVSLRLPRYMDLYVCMKDTHACPQYSGRDSDSPPIIPLHWYYSVISTKWLRGRFSMLSTHQSNPPTLFLFLLFSLQVILIFCSLLYSGSPFTPPPANWSILHCGGLLTYTIYESCPETSIKAMCYQKEYILCCTWFAFELRGSELQILSVCNVNYYFMISCHTLFHWLTACGSRKRSNALAKKQG